MALPSLEADEAAVRAASESDAIAPFEGPWRIALRDRLHHADGIAWRAREDRITDERTRLDPRRPSAVAEEKAALVAMCGAFRASYRNFLRRRIKDKSTAVLSRSLATERSRMLAEDNLARRCEVARCAASNWVQEHDVKGHDLLQQYASVLDTDIRQPLLSCIEDEAAERRSNLAKAAQLMEFCQQTETMQRGDVHVTETSARGDLERSILALRRSAEVLARAVDDQRLRLLAKERSERLEAMDDYWWSSIALLEDQDELGRRTTIAASEDAEYAGLLVAFAEYEMMFDRIVAMREERAAFLRAWTAARLGQVWSEDRARCLIAAEYAAGA